MRVLGICDMPVVSWKPGLTIEPYKEAQSLPGKWLSVLTHLHAACVIYIVNRFKVRIKFPVYALDALEALMKVT